MRNWHLLALVSAAALLVAACSGGDDAVEDTGVVDSKVPTDASAGDSGGGDTAAPDSGVDPDTGGADAALDGADSAVSDSQVGDTADSGVPDSGSQDVGTTDSNTADSNVTDTGTTDTNPAGCTGSDCTLSPQGGCPADQGCDVDETGAVKLCRSAGVAPTGAECSGSEACQVGATCFGYFTPKYCRDYCTNNGDCSLAGAGSICVPLVGDDLLQPYECSDATACSLSCNLMTSAGCGAGKACQIIIDDDSSNWGTDCRASGSGTALTPCGSFEDCQAGAVCIDTANPSNPQNGTCLSYCRVGMDVVDCGIGTCCPIPNRPAVFDGVEYGVCSPFGCGA